MNKYILCAGLCYAISTPIGVHIGYQMALSNWAFVVIETVILMIIHMIAPIVWIKAQTVDIHHIKK
jgi:hypothetical protein